MSRVAHALLFSARWMAASAAAAEEPRGRLPTLLAGRGYY